MPNPCVPPGEKWSGEQSQISWAYFPEVVRTNEIARFLLPSTSLISYSSISTFFSRYDIMNVARWHCHKSVHQPKKFDLVHPTVSPHEKVGSGGETNVH